MRPTETLEPNPARQPTLEQRAAIEASGNVLVVAGAGTGKTTTLVERVLARMAHPNQPLSLDQLLMVTFTEAAAAEMRHRLRAALEAKVAQAAPGPPWIEQLALVDTARICTLHSFCLQLVRDHFHELSLDPDLTVLAQDQAQAITEATLGALAREHLLGEAAVDLAVQQWVIEVGRGSSRPLHQLVLRLHHYTQTRPDPGGWFEAQLALLEDNEPRHWRQSLCEGYAEWRDLWLPELDALAPENATASAVAEVLRHTPPGSDLPLIDAALKTIQVQDRHWPRGTKTKFRKPIEKLFTGADFLQSLTDTSSPENPLTQDWTWTRPQLRALLTLTQEFARRYAHAKREIGAVDFHDLEQFALDLLWDRLQQEPTELARRWRSDLAEILVDEYQDINAAQDTLIRALGREGTSGNRFLVGDVKQSIYRFRLADPGIFQAYTREWGDVANTGCVITLTENFRSRPGILEFTNRLFTDLMQPAVGGLRYTREEWLRSGSPPASTHPEPAVELQLLLSSKRGTDPEGPSNPEREASWIAQRIRTLVLDGTPIRDRASGSPRSATWSDIAILLRSPRTRSEVYARAFARAGIPLEIGRTGFYEALEILDLLSLLQILDNPRQDIPLLAVLRSPIGGFTAEELAALRIAQPRGPLWTALRTRLREGPPQDPTWIRSRAFLQSYQQWRRLSRVASLSECLETLLEDTAYESWLDTQPAVEQTRANVRRFLSLTRQFDQFQRQGLHRFLRFVEAQQDAAIDPEPASASPTDAVRLLSIHQSKGLEFPIVVLANLDKRFNFEDLHARVILDETLGPCPLVQPPQGRPAYPSLPYWLASHRQRRETLGEELRLLYVACTRARDRLLLCGTATSKQLDEQWPQTQGQPSVVRLLAASNWLDWLGPWWTANGGLPTPAGTDAPTPWSAVVVEPDAAGEPTSTAGKPCAPTEAPQSITNSQWSAAIEPARLSRVRSRLSTPYPHLGATREAAKASVSALRSRVRNASDEEARLLFVGGLPKTDRASDELSATARGTAHHRLMERMPLQKPVTQGLLVQCVHELQNRQVLTPTETNALDLEGVLQFWQSDLGMRLQRHHEFVQRELPFTARFSPGELRRIGVPLQPELPEDEILIVQGVVDLAVVLPDTVWILDFKTDDLSDSDLEARVLHYRPQLALYAQALGGIYRRPVRELWMHFLHLRTSVPLPPSHEPGPPIA